MKYNNFFKNLDTHYAIDGISNEGIKTFFSLFFGIICFMHNEQMSVLDRHKLINEAKSLKFMDLEKEIFGSYSMRFKIEGNNSNPKYILLDLKSGKIIYLYYDNEQKYTKDEISNILDYERKFYHNRGDEDNHLQDFFIFDDVNESRELIELLLDVAHDNYTNNEPNKKLFLLRQKFYDRKDWFYRFVLGAGVNYGYDMMTWKDLQKSFDNCIDTMLGTINISEKITEEVFNANYGSFQILKDINLKEYYNILEKLVRFDKTKRSLSDGKTMQAIVELLNYQSHKCKQQNVLTFNYDTVLEYFLGYKKVKSVFVNDSILDAPINIIHSHGVLPFENPKFLKREDYYDTIVLTTKEYFKNYDNGGYGNKSLMAHLDETCFFIGNSITDYEEQKVISNHFKKNKSQFHFAFFSVKYYEDGKEKILDDRIIMYKTVFLLKIGIIPLWFGSHDEYVTELMSKMAK